MTIRTLDLSGGQESDGDVNRVHQSGAGPAPIPIAWQARDVRDRSCGPCCGFVYATTILNPMNSHMREVHATRQAIEAACRELDARGTPYARNYSLGAMVEIPAIAIAIEPFVEALDFLSIGTNDLIQYTLAVDRGDADVADLYDPMHPAVLRLIAHTINAGERAGKPVAVCGEIAGDARVTRMLLGLGLTEFSMHPQQLLDVKKEVRQAHSNALRVQVATALNRAERIDLASLSN